MPALPKNVKNKLEQLTSNQLVIIAFVASCLVAFMLYFYLSGIEDKQQQTVQPLAGVVVAAADIPERTVIGADMLKIVHMPQELVQPDALHDVNEATGKIAKVRILQGDPLTSKKIYTDAKLEGFIGGIPPDKRAISIAITDTTGISGFAKTGDYVDVMLVTDKSQKNAIAGKMLLQNILLLAVNKNTDAAGNKKDSTKEQMVTATLAVSPEEAIRLAVAQSQGTVYLVLRPVNPAENYVLTTEIIAPQAGQGTVEAAPPPPAAVAPAAPVGQAPAPPEIRSLHNISVIRGNSMDTVNVR